MVKFIHSRAFEVVIGTAVVLATLVAYFCGEVLPVEGDRGILFPSPNRWIASPLLSLLLNLGLTLLIALAAGEINKSYNIMRSQTALWGTLFMVMQGSLPSLAGQFYGGSLLCLVIVGATMILFSCYAEGNQTRRLFLIFFVITVLALFQYAAIFYLPVMLVALIQMRVFTLRSLIAAFLGIISPLFCLFGWGIVTPSDVSLPEFVGIFSVLSGSEMVLTFAVVGMSILLGITAMSVNLMKTLSYTAKFRAMNGMINFLMFATIAFVIIDYRNLATYLPLLFFTLSYQVAHAFANHRSRRSFIPVLGIIAGYLVFYILSYWL